MSTAEQLSPPSGSARGAPRGWDQQEKSTQSSIVVTSTTTTSNTTTTTVIPSAPLPFVKRERDRAPQFDNSNNTSLVTIDNSSSSLSRDNRTKNSNGGSGNSSNNNSNGIVGGWRGIEGGLHGVRYGTEWSASSIAAEHEKRIASLDDDWSLPRDHRISEDFDPSVYAFYNSFFNCRVLISSRYLLAHRIL
jgi:hypothetical protein